MNYVNHENHGSCDKNRDKNYELHGKNHGKNYGNYGKNRGNREKYDKKHVHYYNDMNHESYVRQ